MLRFALRSAGRTHTLSVLVTFLLALMLLPSSADGQYVLNLPKPCAGKAPTAQDADGDGLPDSREYTGATKANGWEIKLCEDWDEEESRCLGSGAESRTVYAKAGDADSDDDGLCDGDEKLLGTDPEDPDTDGDLVPDYHEVFRFDSKPYVRNSDGDRLLDGEEVQHGTSPIMSDTDGDAWDDGFEAKENLTNPLVADLPRLAFDLTEGPTDIGVKVSFSESESEAEEFSTSHGQSTSTSRGKTESNSTTNELGTHVGAEFGYAGKSPHFLMSIDVSTAHSRTHDYAVSEDLTQSVSETVGEARSAARETGRSWSDGWIRQPVVVRNTGTRAADASSLALNVSLQRPDGTEAILGELTPYQTGSSYGLAQGEATERIVFERTDVDPQIALEAIANPSWLRIVPGNFTLSNMEGTEWAFVRENVQNRTALLMIDFGASGCTWRVNPNEPEPRRFSWQVATNVERSRETATAAARDTGIQLREVLREVLGLEFEAKAPAKGKAARLTKLTYDPAGPVYCSKATQADPNQGFWRVVASDAVDMHRKHFGRIPLRHGDAIALIYTMDADGDGVPRDAEMLHGSSDDKANSDADVLSDKREILEGCDVTLKDPEGNPLTTYTSYPSPAVQDTDGDTVGDGDECLNRKTDPRLPDTDFDGKPDASDAEPLVPYFNVTIKSAKVARSTVELGIQVGAGGSCLEEIAVFWCGGDEVNKRVQGNDPCQGWARGYPAVTRIDMAQYGACTKTAGAALLGKPAYAYLKTGTYTVRVKATDAHGFSKSATREVTISGDPASDLVAAWMLEGTSWLRGRGGGPDLERQMRGKAFDGLGHFKNLPCMREDVACDAKCDGTYKWSFFTTTGRCREGNALDRASLDEGTCAVRATDRYGYREAAARFGADGCGEPFLAPSMFRQCKDYCDKKARYAIVFHPTWNSIYRRQPGLQSQIPAVSGPPFTLVAWVNPAAPDPGLPGEWIAGSHALESVRKVGLFAELHEGDLHARFVVAREGGRWPSEEKFVTPRGVVLEQGAWNFLAFTVDAKGNTAIYHGTRPESLSWSDKPNLVSRSGSKGTIPLSGGKSRFVVGGDGAAPPSVGPLGDYGFKVEYWDSLDPASRNSTTEGRDDLLDGDQIDVGDAYCSSMSSTPHCYKGPSNEKWGNLWSFRGRIDDVRIYKTALSQEELELIYWEARGNRAFVP